MISAEKQTVLDLFTKGRNFYKLMQFEEALAAFAQALEIDSNDGPSQVYHARCQHYIDNPPPDDWDGVFVMTTK